MWSPNEVRKLISQFAGILLCCAGFYLLINGIKTTEGHINISTSVFSGEIESASAGIFLIFLALPLIILPIFSSNNISLIHASTVNDGKSEASLSETTKGVLVTTACTAISLCFILGGDFLETSYGFKSAGIIVFAGAAAGFVAFLLFCGTVFSVFEDRNQEAEKETPNKSLKDAP